MIDLSSIDSFREIPEKHVMDLQNKCKLKDYSKGNFLYHAADSIDGIFVVLKGQFISYRLTPEGKPCTVRIFSKGDFIGEEDFLSGSARDAYVESTLDSQCFLIQKKDYENLLITFPQFSRSRLEILCKRLKETEKMMQEIAYSTLKKRLLLFLTKIGEEIGDSTSDEIKFILGWSHQELASMIGSTRESVTNTISLLQRDGILKFDGKELSIRKNKLYEYL